MSAVGVTDQQWRDAWARCHHVIGYVATRIGCDRATASKHLVRLGLIPAKRRAGCPRGQRRPSARNAHVLATVATLGSQQAAADHLGITRQAVSDHLRRAREAGL